MERFLHAIANKLPGSLDLERSSLLHKVLELKKRDPLPPSSRNRISSVSSVTPPALPDRRGSNSSAGSRSSISSRTSSISQSGPAVPPRPDEPQETYDCIDADPGFDKKATLPRAQSASGNQPAYLLTSQDRKEPPLPPRRPETVVDNVYEPPAPASEEDGVYMDAEVHKDQDEAYQLMEQPTSQVETKGGKDRAHIDVKPPSASTASAQKTRRSSGKVTMDSIIAPDYSGTLKRKAHIVVPKWIEQAVIVKDNMIYIGDKDSSGEVAEFFSLSNAVIESVKIARQPHAFRIKPMVGKTTIFVAASAMEMHEWIRVLSKAKNTDPKGNPRKVPDITAPPTGYIMDDTAAQPNEYIMDDMYEVPEIEEPKSSHQKKGKWWNISYVLANE